MPRVGFKHSLETRKKISETLTGKTSSYETRQKMSEAMRGNKNGQGNKGVSKSLEHKRMMSEAHQIGAFQNTPFYQRGESHPRHRADVRELKKYLLDDLREGMTIRGAAGQYACSTSHINTILDEHLDETGEDRSIYVRPRGRPKKRGY